MGINYPASRHLAFATSGIDKRWTHLPMRQLTLFEAYAVDRPAAVAVAAAATTTTSVCYVCHEPTTNKCQCACRAVVHADCLLRSIRTADKAHCTICLGPIANLRTRRWRRVSRRITIGLVVTGAAICYSSVFAAIMVGMYVEEKDSEASMKHVIPGIGALMQAWAGSKLFSWLVEQRDLTAEHVEYEYR